MQTRVLGTDKEGHGAAAAIWRAGGLVAFPTETVYGLGADARSDLAVARIFEAKGRPRFNPLIVHVADAAAARALVAWSDAAERLASAFWPGPLTLVLPLREGAGISGLVTAGLGTLAVRVPAHPVARGALSAFGGPVAAPSANPSACVPRCFRTSSTRHPRGAGRATRTTRAPASWLPCPPPASTTAASRPTSCARI